MALRHGARPCHRGAAGGAGTCSRRAVGRAELSLSPERDAAEQPAAGPPAFASLADAAALIVATPDPAGKGALTRTARALWLQRTLSLVRPTLDRPMPPRPGRPARPALLAPREMPQRRLGTPAGRIAFCHAIAHIELNAVDLAWDIVGRFAAQRMPRSFFDDWVEVAFEEATHFALLAERLASFGASYGDLPAHDGLWQAAEATAGDLHARLAIVPLVLEARGLDVTPSMIAHFTAAGDPDTAAVLRRIYEDEKGHVYVGAAWFRYLCDRNGLRPEPTFQHLVRRHFRGQLKAPFNDRARSAACLTPGFYRPLETVRV